ncbi:MAG: hypothetical protein WAT17_04360 [Candidatus Saccharimonadales bacterium]
MSRLPVVGSDDNSWGTVLNDYLSVAHNSDGTQKISTILPYSYGGSLSVTTGTFRLYNDSGNTWTIQNVRASVGTAPTGSSAIIDINVDGTTIFSTQANRPTIAVSTNTSGLVSNMNTTTVANGSYMTVDIDQVGSTVAGSDLTVQIGVK